MKLKGLLLATAIVILTGSAYAETEINVLSINRDSAEWQALYADMVKEFNDEHPGVTVKVEFMEDESFKQKLPTLLQSKAAPDICLFSWSGGTVL